MFKKILFFIILINFCYESKAIFPINFFRQYDINFRTEKWDNETFELAFQSEMTLDVTARNSLGNEVNILQIWNKNQNALAMVRGFDVDSKIGRVAAKLNNVNDDGVRGHFLPSANFKEFDFSLYGRYFLPHNFSVSLFVPIYSMQITDVNFEDLTKDITIQDKISRHVLSKNFNKLVNNLGGLKLTGCKKTGLGDLLALIEWNKSFPQAKPFLKDVGVNIRFGPSFPTGVKKNEDELLSIPFGYDGSYGILFGGGIDLTFGKYIKCGVDAEFFKQFGNTKDRRIKTDIDQTDLLFLAKTNAFKEFGITQIFNLYLEAHKFLKGLSFRVAYQFFRHDEDKLWLFDNAFSTAVANSAENLQEWTIHQLLFILNYDFLHDYCECPSWVPNINLFCKWPFEGVRSVQLTTVGLAFSFSF